MEVVAVLLKIHPGDPQNPSSSPVSASEACFRARGGRCTRELLLPQHLCPPVPSAWLPSPRPGCLHTGSAASLHPQAGCATGEWGQGTVCVGVSVCLCACVYVPVCTQKQVYLVTMVTYSQAREMTLQALALQQQPLSATSRPQLPEVSRAAHDKQEYCDNPGVYCASLRPGIL